MLTIHSHPTHSYTTSSGRRYCYDCGNPDCPNACGDPYWAVCPARRGQASHEWSERHDQRLQGALCALGALLSLVAARHLEDRAERKSGDALEAIFQRDDVPLADQLALAGQVSDLMAERDEWLGLYARTLGMPADAAWALLLGGERE